MRTLIVSIAFALFLLGCSDTGPVLKLPAMNSYDDEQNFVLEKFEWLGFPSSIVRTERISEDLAVIFGYGGNVLVSVGDDGVLIVDSQFPEVYEAIMAEIKKLGGSSVDYIINTHFHFDHAEGNRAFGMQGAKIIAHQNSVDFFERGAEIDMVAISLSLIHI